MKNNESYNRIRPLKIWEILQAETDEEHPMSTEELRARLAENGITSHRTTIYEDIKLLNDCGYEIMKRRGRGNLSYVEDRKFSGPELHILLDAVQAANFITEKKTDELVDKIASLAGSQKGNVLKQNIVQFNTSKSSNERIYYSVNEIVTAINEGKKIIFLYFDYDNNHKRVYRRDGHHYVVSPYATIFADGHYYLIIYDKRYNKMSHYRIDRMDKVQIIDELAEMPPKDFEFDIATYKKQLFGMFSGNTTKVGIEVHKSLRDVIFDLFGEGTQILPCKREDYVRINVNVQVCDLFFGWCCSFGDKLKVVGPDNIVESLVKYTKQISKVYEE